MSKFTFERPILKSNSMQKSILMPNPLPTKPVRLPDKFPNGFLSDQIDMMYPPAKWKLEEQKRRWPYDIDKQC
jgi:hypothetical protein